jgi:hypothetical protein
VHDFGATDAEGNTTYQYTDAMVDAVLDLVLLELSNYSGDGSTITPTVSDNSVLGYLVYATAFRLAADPERIKRWREGDITIEREDAKFIMLLGEKAQQFYEGAYGQPYAKRGALEDFYDYEEFVDYWEDIINPT